MHHVECAKENTFFRSTSWNSWFVPCSLTYLWGGMRHHAVPKFCNSGSCIVKTTCVFLHMGKLWQSSEDHAIGWTANQAMGEFGNSLGGRQWRQCYVFVVSGAAGIGKSRSAEQPAPHTHKHTYAHTHKPFFDTHLAREAPVLIKGSVLDACFCWWHVSFPSAVSVYGHVNFSAAWTRFCVLVSVTPIWLTAVSFRCALFSCSLISWGPAITGRKPFSWKCLSGTVQLASAWT